MNAKTPRPRQTFFTTGDQSPKKNIYLHDATRLVPFNKTKLQLSNNKTPSHRLAMNMHGSLLSPL